MNRAARKLPLFECSGDYAAFECVLIDALARSDVSLYAYCAMPNHRHIVLSPKADGALSRFMHRLTTIHARRWRLARHADGQGAVYQGRVRAVPVRVASISSASAVVKPLASLRQWGRHLAVVVAGAGADRLVDDRKFTSNRGGDGCVP